MKRTAAKRRPRNTGPDARTRETVGNRAMWRCEFCGGYNCLTQDAQEHHRRPRGMGGTERPETNKPQNLVYLGADCHRLIESSRARALADGWLVTQHDDPATVPVLIRGERWVYLTADGRYSDNPPERAS